MARAHSPADAAAEPPGGAGRWPHLRRLARSWDAIVTVAICAGWGATRGHDANLNIDHAMFLSTVHFMRRGAGYYPAMDRALRGFVGPAATPRAFRMPTIYVFWRLLPNDRLIWLVLVVGIGLMAVGLGRLVQAGWVAPLIALWALYNAWNKFTLVELWGALLVTAALLAWARGHQRWAAVIGLLAALVRETTVVLLVGGVIAAHRQGRPRWPWLAALGISGAAFVATMVAAHPYLVAHGTESPLLGSGRPPFSIARWMGFGLPAGPVLGPALWLLAVLGLLGHLPGRRSLAAIPPLPGIDDLMLAYLALPVLGLLVTRDYWGAELVPFTLAFGAGSLTALVSSRLGAHTAPPRS